jgi:NADH:ubiquinone oxidoreductase subunit E
VVGFFLKGEKNMNQVAIRDIILQLGGENAPLLQILLAVQERNQQQYISEDDVNEIAHSLKISRSRVYSTASFYTELSLKPRGIHRIRVCTNAPCENAGKIEILKALEGELRISIGQTTPDGTLSLENVNCLGACYMSPAIKVDDTIYGYLTPEKVISIIHGIQRGCRHE